MLITLTHTMNMYRLVILVLCTFFCSTVCFAEAYPIEKHFVATVYIINEEEQQVLLIYHKKLKKWLPPGGHLEKNETPPEAAKREVLEETGLEIEFIQQENIWVNCWNAKSFERPYLCLLEEIPSHGNEAAHQHMDMIYVARPARIQNPSYERENIEMRWFSLSQLQELSPDEDIFKETLSTIETILSLNLVVR